MTPEALDRVRRNRLHAPVHLLAQLPGNRPREGGDIVPSLPERRDGNREHTQPVVQVFPERPRGHREHQIAVRGCHDADRHPERSRAAEPLELPRLEHAQEPGLQLEGQLAHLVEKERRSVCQLEAARLPREGAGVGPLLPAEQLALDERRGQRAAVDGHEQPVAPSAQAMDRPGRQFLPRARLAQQQDGRIGRRHALDEFDDASHPGAVRDDAIQGDIRHGAVAQVAVLGFEAVLERAQFAIGACEFRRVAVPQLRVHRDLAEQADPRREVDKPDPGLPGTVDR